MKPYLIVAAALMVGPLAHAQQAWNPSADELISLLKPKADGPTRGIRAIGSPPAPTSSATPVVARTSVMSHVATPRPEAAPTSGDLMSVPLKVQFQNGSDMLTPSAIKTLDTLGRALSSPTLASYRFRIEGHTDAVGSHDLNAALSAHRADAVADYIASHYGIDRSRLTSVGMGDSQMLIPTPVGIPEPRNRRVQVVNIGN